MTPVVPLLKLIRGTYSRLLVSLLFAFRASFGADISIHVKEPQQHTSGDKQFVLIVTDNKGKETLVDMTIPANTRPKNDLGLQTQVAKEKATKIKDALVSKGFSADYDPNDDTKVIVKDVNAIRKASDKTGEVDDIAANGRGPAEGEISFAGDFSGFDFDGGEPEYGASFGFDGFLMTSSIPYSNLPAPTVDGLLQLLFDDLYSQLTVELQPSLSLNLNSDTIAFQFPSFANNSFVTVRSDDPTLSVSQSLSVPDKTSSLILLITALTMLLAADRQARKTIRNGC